MVFALTCLTAFAASALTLFSGFGLGTILTPVFALFFPIETAVAATAVIHLANNVFKLALIGARADWTVVLRFSLTAAAAALIGALLLVHVAALPPITSYDLFGRARSVVPIKLIIGVLIATFAALELSPRFSRLAISPRHLPWGGFLSGFFGGLSGNQGAFRTAFLIKTGLDKEAFVATGVVSAVIVDFVRITVYGVSYLAASFEALPRGAIGIVVAASLAAFAGAIVGARILKKLTLGAVKVLVALMMIVVGLGLASGIL